MITTLMLYALAIGVLVAAGALVLDRAACAVRVPQRFTWVGALVLLVALTVAAPWRMASDDALLVSDASVATTPTSAITLPDVPWHAQLLSTTQSVVRETIGAASARVPAPLDRAIGVAWAGAALFLIVMLALTLRRLDAQRRRWPRARLLDTAVRVGDREGPAVYGLFAPDIVIPRRLLACDTTEQALVLAHEDEHRRAHDPVLLAAAAALVALVPWHPVAWWCLSRLRLATELDCDARVLRRGVSTRHYGEVLLTLAASLPPAPRAAHALALFDSRRHLERRLLAMTTPFTRRSPFAVGGFALAGAVLIAAACNTDVPTAAEVRDADVTAVTRTLGLPTGTNAVTYIVDGKRLSEAEARAIRADDIITIDISRTTERGDEIKIVTLAAAGTVASAEPGKRAFVVERVDSAAIGLVAWRTKGTAGDSIVELSGPMRLEVARNEDDGVVVVRGTRSASGAAQPLVIVDGVISTAPNALQNIKPTQIESIEVIKGDAARVAYGERGANGVIRVTLKK
jgi:beta-lactamase regulating signal transducer with metallopeptidase domain